MKKLIEINLSKEKMNVLDELLLTARGVTLQEVVQKFIEDLTSDINSENIDKIKKAWMYINALMKGWC